MKNKIILKESQLIDVIERTVNKIKEEKKINEATNKVLKFLNESNDKEIKYKGKTIKKLHPSGHFEFYSDNDKRFLKFDDLESAKKKIDSLQKKINENRRNIKTVKITVPNEHILNRLNSTPTFNRLSRLKLQVGKNIENVNHAQFADMVRLYPLLGVTVEEV
jgi:hypothetical protein